MNQKTPDNIAPKADYKLGQIGALPLYLFEAQGPKAIQQDNIVAFVLKAPMSEQRMRELFQVMAAATNAPELHGVLGGTTVNLVAISKNNIIAGNLGDSLTTLFTRKAAGDDLDAVKLSSLHVPDIEGEAQRLEPLVDPKNLMVEARYIIDKSREVPIGVAMSRALGDSAFLPLVIQEPSIHTIDINPDTLDYAQIAAYSDGVTDTKAFVHYDLKFHAEYLGAILDQVFAQENNAHLPLAYGLAYQAMDSGLTDNAIAMSVDLKALDANSHMLIAVFDGHAPEGRKMTEIAIAALQNLPELG